MKKTVLIVALAATAFILNTGSSFAQAIKVTIKNDTQETISATYNPYWQTQEVRFADKFRPRKSTAQIEPGKEKTLTNINNKLPLIIKSKTTKTYLEKELKSLHETTIRITK